VKTTARHGLQDRVTVGSIVVPGQRHLAHQVRIRSLETLVVLERFREPEDATLATDPADLNRFLTEHVYQAIERATRSAQTARNPSAWPTSS